VTAAAAAAADSLAKLAFPGLVRRLPAISNAGQWPVQRQSVPHQRQSELGQLPVSQSVDVVSPSQSVASRRLASGWFKLGQLSDTSHSSASQLSVASCQSLAS